MGARKPSKGGAWPMKRSVLESLAARRKHRKMHGECTECGKPAAPYKTCAVCRKWRARWIAKRRAELHGKRCLVCKGKLAKTSKVFCQEHLDQSLEAGKRAYHRRRAQKKCSRCDLPAQRGKTRCRHHAAVQRAATEASARRRLRQSSAQPSANAHEADRA